MLAVGTDIIEICRVKRAAQRHPSFWDKILTEEERVYCQGKPNPYQHLAGRFAAKEAILKCLGIGLAQGASWHDMEILPTKEGQPQVRLAPFLAEIAQNKGLAGIKLSISHSREYALAVAIGEGV